MTALGPEKQAVSAPRMRIDKWLWVARFYKTRSLATKEVKSGRMRLNGSHVKKPSALISPHDVLTFPKAQRIYVVKVLGLSETRGPASVARLLYDDLSPPQAALGTADEGRGVHARRDAGSGRPTKAERRALDRLTGDL
ncbi:MULTISPECIES: RNA-binding S4 domain-containing protein [unclassified Iodidimonas]|uniref:RNA-binding S4 domain-containing protein n=1 Tax=unclassified Iodidimonas TaxID=2626145 RepID=UPI002482BF8D|nr:MULTISPECIES: RNA-binding S4 domain-containing protein [unclassified Iodidimonas]